MIGVLQKLLSSGDNNLIISEAEKLRNRAQSPEHIEKLGQIINACKVPNTLPAGGHVVDPISGNPYPNTKSMISEYIKELQGIKKMSDNTFNLAKFAQVQKKKKDSRGNPFRVLMGKVGKLLDHGLNKRDIVRYLLKEQIWNEETIEKAVNIVKDYNKKKHIKKKKKAEAQTLMDTAEEWGRMKPDYSKRSTAELVTSLCWLDSLDKYDPKKTVEVKEVADRGGVKTMIREIKSVLRGRGMSEDELKAIAG